MNMDKIKEIFSDEAFVKSLFAMESAAEVQIALKEKGIELSEEDILSIRDMLGKVESGEISAEQLAVWQQQAADGELSDELLEHVAGGSIIVGLVAGALALVSTIGMAAAVDGEVRMRTGRHW